MADIYMKWPPTNKKTDICKKKKKKKMSENVPKNQKWEKYKKKFKMAQIKLPQNVQN